MLVVEGQRVGAGRDAAQRIEIGVRADHHIGGDLRRGIVGVGGQHPQRLAQRDRGLVGHPGQLPAADHGDDRGIDSARRSWCHGLQRRLTCTGARSGHSFPYTGVLVSFADATIARLPRPIRPFASGITS